MASKLKAKSVALGAALATASSLVSADPFTIASPDARPPSMLRNAPFHHADLERVRQIKREELARKTSSDHAESKARADQLKQMIGANRSQRSVGVLYGAVPGAVLGVGDAMIETAMGPARSPMPADKDVWGRIHLSGARPVVATGLKAPIGAVDNSRLSSNTFVAQFGMPIYTNATTRLDATIGLGGRSTQLSPARKREPDLRTYSGAMGITLQHHAPSDLDLRLGAQLSGGGSELKGGDARPFGRDYEKKFRHVGLGLRAEVSRSLAAGRAVVVTPLFGAGASTAWVRQGRGSSDNNSAASLWVSTRVAYNHALQSGRSASFWIEPTYIGQLKRSTTITAQLSDAKFDLTSRLPRDRMGMRVGIDMPLGKQASFQASLSRFWGVGDSRQKEGSLQLGYAHRF